MASDNGDKPIKKKKEYQYDIGCVPSKFWYGFVGGCILVPLACLFAKIKVKPDKDYLNEEGPIVVLGNHPSYLDPIVVERLTHGRPVNFVTGEFLFRSKIWGHLFKLGGAIPKKQFVVDTCAVKAMMKVLKRKGVLAIFPEATRFVDGKSITFDDGVAKLIKKNNAAIYVCSSHGAYLTYPRWTQSGVRIGKVTAEFTQKIPASKVAEMTVEDIQRFILDSLDYNENDYAREVNPTHKSKKLASGLQNVAYACPKCHKEFSMVFDEQKGGDLITCSSCGNQVRMLPNGLLTKVEETDVIFDDLHQWTLWERENTAKQIENPDYKLEMDCRLFKVFDKIDFANTGSGKVYITSDSIIYRGTDCDVADGIPYHKGKIKKGYQNRSLASIEKPVEYRFEISTMKGLVGKIGKCFEIYDSKGELFRFYINGNMVYKIQQIVALQGKGET